MNWRHVFQRCRERLSGRNRKPGWSLAAACSLLMAGPALAQTGEPCNDCGPLDVVFIVDDTGSMGGAIAGIQAGIANIIEQIRCASDEDYQLGLITHSDCVQIDVQLAPGNAAAMATAIAALSAGGGSGTPEASDAALNAAVNSLPAASNCCQDVDFTGTWRPTATKIVILITDAVPGGCDDVFALGTDDVNANTYANNALANGIFISAINVLSFSDPNLVAVMQNYAAVTGGSYLEAPNGTGIEAAITTILDDCGGGDEPCMTIEDVEITCDADDDSKATVTFTVTNNSGVDANYVLFTPQTPGSGSVMFTPNMIPVSIPDGSSATLSTTIMGLGSLTDLSGVEICFSVTLLDPTFQICCSEELCVTPECDCLQVPSATSIVECVPDEPGKYSWTFSFQNLTPDTLHHLYFFPPAGVVIDTPDAADNYINLVPPIAPGGTFGPVKVIITDTALAFAPGDELTILLSIHDQFLNQCCAREVKVTIPDCDPEPITGACCLSTGVPCVQVTAAECAAIGIYLGDGTICGDPTTPCPGGLEFGACCLPDGVCVDLIAIECEFAMGVFYPGTSCDANPDICFDVPTGGCCLCDGTCVDLPKDECVLVGTYLGDFVFCGTPGVICPPPDIEFGACCLNDGCAILPKCECVAVGGFFLGVGTDCSTALAECRGACCLPDGTCFETPLFFECENGSGVFLGPGTTCADCPPPVTLAGDCNADGVVDADDLGGILAAFGTNNSTYDFNGDGVVNADDLAILLANFGATAGSGG